MIGGRPILPYVVHRAKWGEQSPVSGGEGAEDRFDGRIVVEVKLPWLFYQK
jgi:hypothetical protein